MMCRRGRSGGAVPKILVVDDDEGVRTTVCDLLELAGYECERACDGEQALELLAPDIDGMLLDLAMPKMDGFAVLDALSDWPVVIVMSAFEYWNQRETEARYGNRVSAFLRKPVPPPVLLDTVKTYIG